MEGLQLFDPRPYLMERTVDELRACNGLSGRYGLLLGEGDIQSLAEHRFAALKDTGRIEFGEGILKKLVYAFCDSPYLSQHHYADFLHEILASFYYFKAEALEQMSDDELIAQMKEHFNGECRGSLEYLNGMALEELCRGLRFGEGAAGRRL